MHAGQLYNGQAFFFPICFFKKEKKELYLQKTTKFSQFILKIT